jgi:hypothetical protein
LFDADSPVREAAAALRSSESTIWRKITAGELAAKRLGMAHGSAVRIPVVELRRLLDGGDR